MQKNEIEIVQKYLRKKFDLDKITIKNRPIKDESAEVFIGDEFIGILFKDIEDDDLSYTFEMSILDFDLQDC